MHIREGTLRAYLDGQASPKQRQQIEEHLCACEACRARLERLEANRSHAATALPALKPAPDTAPPDSSAAFARFREQHLIHQDQKRRKATMKTRTHWSRWRPAWIGLTVLMIVSLFVFYPPLRTAASDFLGVFRVRKFAAVPINI